MKTRNFPSTLMLCAVLALASKATAQLTYYVDDDGASGGDGTLSNPFNNVQAAMNAASSGDTVLVMPGTYGDVDFLGKGIQLRSLEGPLVTELNTALFVAGEQRTSVLSGFLFSAGFPEAVKCIGSSPVIEYNIIEQYVAGWQGESAISVLGGSSPLIQYNELRDNFANAGSGRGGAIYVRSSAPLIIANQLVGNYAFEDMADAFGGGIYLENSTANIKDNLFANNGCFDFFINKGGAIYASDCTLDLEGNTFVGNFSQSGAPPFSIPSEGGAVYLLRCVTRCSNNSFWGNSADVGHEVYERSGALTIAYCNIERSEGGLSLGQNVDMGAGNIEADPQLDASYHLRSHSPLIDMGRPNVPPGGMDNDQDPRVLDGNRNRSPRIDIGWDEWNPSVLVVTGDGSLGSSLGMSTQGPPGQNYILAGSLETGCFPFKAYGSFLLGFPGLMIIGSGSVPGLNTLDVPTSLSLIGQTAYFQALVRQNESGIGSFTRRVDVRLH